MFIGRTKELRELTNEITNKKSKTAILIYGKRRVGKSTLIKEAAKSFDGIVINHLCIDLVQSQKIFTRRMLAHGLALTTPHPGRAKMHPFRPEVFLITVSLHFRRL